MQFSYFIDKDYTFPTSRVEVHSSVVIADIMLPDGRKTTICNPRDWEHRILDDNGKTIDVIERI